MIHMRNPKLPEISSRPKPPLRKTIAAKTSASDDISMNPDHLCSNPSITGTGAAIPAKSQPCLPPTQTNVPTSTLLHELGCNVH